MTSPFNTGPIAPYRNVPIEPEYFKPSVFIISNIVRGPTTFVTTIGDQNYVVGQLVRFTIPEAFGIGQINEQLAYVIRIVAANQVEVDVDSSQFDPFISSTVLSTQPQIMAVGDNNSGIISSNGRVVSSTTIQGAFQNISP
jgi:hypothetical protein